MSKEEVKVEPCPFCGSACEDREERGWYACSNSDCPAWHIQALAEDWNKRVTPVPPACDEPQVIAKADDPCQWSDAQILEFLGVALRNVDVRGTVRPKEVRQGFQYMRNPNRKPTESGANE